MKKHNSRIFAVVGISIALSIAAAQTAAQTFKIIGAAFIEAPPGRDKNLVPFSAGQSQEKAEVHAILSVNNGLLIDIARFSRDQSVMATGMYANKSTFTLGTVDISSFPRVSADGKSMLVSMSVSRLSDKPVVAINFAGTVKVRSARGTSNKSAKFIAKSGSLIELGLGDTKVAKIDGGTVTFEGSSALERVSAMKFVGADGKMNAGENVGSGRINDRYEVSYRFTTPLTDGRIEATLFEGMETNDVPVRLTITRPY